MNAGGRFYLKEVSMKRTTAREEVIVPDGMTGAVALWVGSLLTVGIMSVVLAGGVLSR